MLRNNNITELFFKDGGNRHIDDEYQRQEEEDPEALSLSPRRHRFKATSLMIPEMK